MPKIAVGLMLLEIFLWGAGVTVWAQEGALTPRLIELEERVAALEDAFVNSGLEEEQLQDQLLKTRQELAQHYRFRYNWLCQRRSLLINELESASGSLDAVEKMLPTIRELHDLQLNLDQLEMILGKWSDPALPGWHRKHQRTLLAMRLNGFKGRIHHPLVFHRYVRKMEREVVMITLPPGLAIDEYRPRLFEFLEKLPPKVLVVSSQRQLLQELHAWREADAARSLKLVALTPKATGDVPFIYADHHIFTEDHFYPQTMLGGLAGAQDGVCGASTADYLKKTLSRRERLRLHFMAPTRADVADARYWRDRGAQVSLDSRLHGASRFSAAPYLEIQRAGLADVDIAATSRARSALRPGGTRVVRGLALFSLWDLGGRAVELWEELGTAQRRVPLLPQVSDLHGDKKY